METNEPDKTTAADSLYEFDDSEVEVDPINDIIDYLVRCAKISFKNAHLDESEVHTSDKIKMACEIYKQSPTDFLLQFGKYLAPHHIGYFENLQSREDDSFRECINQLKTYHSDKSKCKRIRNRRYNALQRLQNTTDYFSEKQMMYRNPLLYEQLVGQYLSDEEIKERDGVDNENLTFLSMILETVDRNDMREMKNEQMLEEDLESMKLNTEDDSKSSDSENIDNFKSKKQWGAFDTPDTRPNYMPEPRKQSMISAPERNLLREEFLQEMFCSFIEGRDADVDYNTIDSNEEYDDLQQVSQDAEDRYFDTESNDIENLEEHMKLVQEYGRKNSESNLDDDPLDEFMMHLTNKLIQMSKSTSMARRSRGSGRVSACGERVRYEWARARPHADSVQTSCGKRAGAARAHTVTFVYIGVLTGGRTNMFLIKQHILLLLFLVTVTTSRSFSSDLVAANSAPINQIANVTYGAEIENQGSLTSIFSPRMDFEQWKPLTGRGDPLRNDPTYDYEPPVLERVHYWAEETRLEREHYPERKSEVLMLGVSSRKPSVTSRQPPLPPRRHIHRPQPNKYEDFTYKLSDHYPMTILVPPPPPPPGHQPPLFILSDDKASINNKAQSPMKPNNSPQNLIPDSTNAPEHLTSLYALQESNLIYQSSTTTQNWLRDSNETKILENAVSSDYAGWGPTTPVDDNDAANDTHNLIFNDHIEFSRHPYSFYKPMLSESPPPPKVIHKPSVAKSTFIPTALPPTTAVPATVSFTQVTWPTEQTTEMFEVTTETPQDTTEKRTTIVFEPTPVPTTTAKLEISLIDMLGPMMSMPMINGPERPEDNLYAHASETVNIFNENKPEDPQIETMQTMQPPPPVKPAESSTAPHKQQFHVNSQVSNKKSAFYTHGPYLHNRFTTPIPTTIEESSENLKQTTETPTVPMYLIIQGHSKVKTYGSKPKVPDSKETVNNEVSKPLETNEVKHLHPIIKKSAKKLDIIDASRKYKGKNLKSLVDSGLGSIEIQETDVGIKYDVSDGSDVPIEIYRKGIVDNEENNYSTPTKSAKELRRKRQIELEDLLPFDEEVIEEYVYNFLEGRKNETGITGLIAQAVTSDAAQAVDELEDDDDSEQEEER